MSERAEVSAQKESTEIDASASASASASAPEVVPEEESTATYAPVVKLDEVHVATGEEDDIEKYKQRAVLYRFAQETNEWKERGRGDVKLMRNKDTGMVRVLMRQDKTLKLCLNHLVPPTLALQPNAGSDRAYTWRSIDYSEDTPRTDTFAIRFKDSETANSYKSEWDAARSANQQAVSSSSTAPAAAAPAAPAAADSAPTSASDAGTSAAPDSA